MATTLCSYTYKHRHAQGRKCASKAVMDGYCTQCLLRTGRITFRCKAKHSFYVNQLCNAFAFENGYCSRCESIPEVKEELKTRCKGMYIPRYRCPNKATESGFCAKCEPVSFLPEDKLVNTVQDSKAYEAPEGRD